MRSGNRLHLGLILYPTDNIAFACGMALGILDSEYTLFWGEVTCDWCITSALLTPDSGRTLVGGKMREILRDSVDPLFS